MRAKPDATPGSRAPLSGSGLPQPCRKERKARAVAAPVAFCLLLAAALIVPQSAPGAVGFAQPRTLSAKGGSVTGPALAIDSQDRVTVVWGDEASSSTRVSRLGPDGVPESVQSLPVGASFVYAVAIDSQDRATIVWLTPSSAGGDAVRTVRLGADGTPGATHTLSAGGASGSEPKLAIDSRDRATVVWTAFDGEDQRVAAVRLDADGMPGTVQELSRPVRSGPPNPQVAIDSRDQVTVVWNGPSDGVEAVRLGADGTPGSVRTLSSKGVDPTLAIDSRDRATVVFEHPRGIRAVRLGADGRPGRVRRISAGSAFQPRLAIDSRDRATVVWERFVSDFEGDEFSQIRVARLGTDGKPGRARTLSETKSPDLHPYSIAIDSRDRATVGWEHGHLKATRLGPGGRPGGVTRISRKGEIPSAPQLAIDSRDRATVGWLRRDPDGEGQAIRYTRSAFLAIPGKRLRLSRGRVVKAKLGCPATVTSAPCKGVVRLKTWRAIRPGAKRRAMLFAKRRFKVSAGETKRVRLRLRRRKAKLVRKRRRARKVVMSARFRDEETRAVTVRKKMKLALPARTSKAP